jgi:polyisoprenoid-binding protein YceI
LIINGITKSITLDLKHGGTILDLMDGITKAGFKLTGVINRYDFGLKWNIASSAKSCAVREEIELVCNMRLNMVSDEVKVTPSAEKVGN